MDESSQLIGKLLVKWEWSEGHRIDHVWLLPAPVVGWISTESLQGSLHRCCSCKDSVFKLAIPRSLDKLKFWSLLEIGRETQKLVFLMTSVCVCEWVGYHCGYLWSVCSYSGCMYVDLWTRIRSEFQNKIIVCVLTVHSHPFMSLFLCFPPSLTWSAALEEQWSLQIVRCHPACLMTFWNNCLQRQAIGVNS